MCCAKYYYNSITQKPFLVQLSANIGHNVKRHKTLYISSNSCDKPEKVDMWICRKKSKQKTEISFPYKSVFLMREFCGLNLKEFDECFFFTSDLTWSKFQWIKLTIFMKFEIRMLQFSPYVNQVFSRKLIHLNVILPEIVEIT